MDYKTFTTTDGRTIKASKVEAPGDVDVPGVTALAGQWVVEEEKLVEGVKVFSHYVIDGPDPAWKGFEAEDVLALTEEDRLRKVLTDEIGSMPEAEVIDKARLYGIEGDPGEPLKTSLVKKLVDHIAGGGTVANPGEQVHEIAPSAVVEPVDVDAIKKQMPPPIETTVTPSEGDVSADSADSDRPSGNASAEEWRGFRTSQGYKDSELSELTRNELRDLSDR